MTKAQWNIRIKDACESAGLYQPMFDFVISSLSELLEKRDEAQEQYEASGSHPVISHTNRAGVSNLCKNPCLVIWADLNQQALTYWRDLGLTPSGFKKLSEQVEISRKKSSLELALEKLSAAQ